MFKNIPTKNSFYEIFGKLSRNILDILGHDVKFCDLNLPFSQYFAYILTNSTSICITQNAAKIHARCMWFKFRLVPFTNASISLRYYSFISINV